jgi:hypothetical protein
MMHAVWQSNSVRFFRFRENIRENFGFRENIREIFGRFLRKLFFPVELEPHKHDADLQHRDKYIFHMLAHHRL